MKPLVEPNSPLRRARIERGFKIHEVAKQILITESGLSYIERGDRSPSPEHARLLFDFYRGEIDWPTIFHVPATAAEARRVLKMRK